MKSDIKVESSGEIKKGKREVMDGSSGEKWEIGRWDGCWCGLTGE